MNDIKQSEVVPGSVSRLGVFAHFQQSVTPRRSAPLLRSPALLPLVLATLSAASATAGAAPNTSIVANGRTNTQVVQNDDVWTVTTGTVSGQTGFNAFSQFLLGSGHTANLKLSGDTRNLVNLVDSKVEIHGTLNSLYESGQIGGNVFFASPAGFVVGKDGVINVGSLAVTTPTQAAMDAVLENLDAAALMDGSIALEPGAVISIEGKVNALDSVTLRAPKIEVPGQILVGDQAQAAIEALALNIDGQLLAAGLIEDGGTIRLIGRDSVSVSGTLAANRVEDGEILITATKVVEIDSGIAEAEAVVDISGEVSGGNIVVRAVAKAGAEFDDAAAERGDGLTLVDAADLSVIDLLELGVDFAKGEAELGAVWAKADARVIVRDGAALDAAHDLTLEAQAERIAKTPALKTKPDKTDLYSIAAVLGAATGTTEVRVEDGARLEAGEEVTIQARSVNQVDVQATSVTANEESYAALTLAVGIADVDTNVRVDAGATLESGGQAHISARNDNAFGVEAAVMAVGDAVIGGAAALSHFSTTADAELAASLDAGQVAGDLVIDARSHTSENLVSATTATGAAPSSKLQKVKDGASKLGTLVQKAQKKGEDKADKAAGNNEPDSGQPVKLSSALALSFNDHGASARIADGAKVEVGGDLVVNAQVKSEGIRNIAESKVTTQAKKREGDGLVTGSAAIAIGIFRHDAQAIVGEGAELAAERIGVNASSELPLTVTVFDKWDTEAELLDNLAANLSVPNPARQIFTSHANATGQAEEFGFAGALSYFESENSARAWIGDGAKLASRADGGAWSSELDGDFRVDWQDAVSVQASTVSESINVAGNYQLLGLGGTGGGKEAASVGGAFNWVNYSNTAEAGIGAGAVVSADGVVVDAHSRDWFLTLSPSAGKGTSIAGNGIFALNQIDNRTHASISHDATIEARRLGLDAYQELAVWSFGGALAQGEAVSAAAAIAANDVRTDTRAFIGDNAAGPDEEPAREGSGSVSADLVRVEAITDGQVVSIAVAGAVTSSSEPKPKADGESDGGFIGKIKGLLSFKTKKASDQANAQLDGSSVVDKASQELNAQQTAQGEQPGQHQPQTKPLFGLSVSGAATATIAEQDTQAYIDGVTIRAYDSDQRTDLAVQAKNDTDLISVGGAAAFSRANKESVEYHAAVAGAVSFNLIDNDTYAGLRHMTMERAGEVAVQALTAGDSVAIGIAPALDASGQGEGGSAAASVSISWIEGSTRAEIADSTLEGEGDLEVTAYDRAQTITGGGALNAGKGKLGLGLSASLAHVAKDTVARIADSQISGFDAVGARAIAVSRLITAAGNIGATKDGTVLVGSFVFNDLANTVRAEVSGSTLEDISGNVDVLAASSSSEPALDALLGARRDRGLETSLDPGQAPELEEGEEQVIQDARFGADRGGALVIGVAGTGAGGGNAAGLSAVANVVRNQYQAVLEGTQVSTDGEVSVSARDDSQVIGVAVGVAGAKDTFAGMGSVVGNVATGSVTARVGELDADGHTTIISAAALDVSAYDGTELWAGAGSVAGSGGKAGIGASVAFNATTDIDVDDSGGRGTEAIVVNTDLELGADGGSGALKVDALADSSLRAIAVSGAGSSGVALGGSLSFNLINDQVAARLSGSKVNAQQVTVSARDRDEESGSRASIWALAGNVVGSSGQAAVGASFAVNTIASSLEAEVKDSHLTVDSDTLVAAESGSEIISIAVGGAGTSGTAAGISSTVNTIAKSVHARLIDSTVTDGSGMGNLFVRAGDRWDDGGNGSTIWSLAGNVSGAGKVAAGLAAAVNTISNELVAEVEGSTVDLDGAVLVKADSGSEIKSAAVAGGGAGTAAVQGSLAVNTVANTTRATVQGGSLGGGQVRVEARERSAASDHRTTIHALAGSVSGAGTAAVGGAVAVNTIANDLIASVDAATIEGDSLQVLTATGSEIKSAAASGAGAGTAAVNGAATINTIANRSLALLANATVTADTLRVQASDVAADGGAGSLIQSLAGNVNGAGTASVGAAAATNTIANTVEAGITGSTLAVSDETEVEALQKAAIETLAADGGGAGTAAVGGSTTINNIANVTRAGIENTGQSGADNATRIAARDESSIDSLAGGARVGGTAGVGAAAAVNRIGNVIDAYLSGGDDGRTFAARNVVLDAASEATIRTIAVGVGAGLNAGIAGSVATSIIDTDVRARIDSGAKVEAENNVGVLASNRDRIEVVAGAAGIGGMNAGIGVSTVVNVIDSITRAYIDAAQVLAHARDLDDTLAVRDGRLVETPSIGEEPDPETFAWYQLEGSSKQVSGVAVNAFSTQQVGAMSVAIGGTMPNPKGSGAVGATADVNVLAGVTEAYVGNGAKVGSGAGDIDVTAGSHSYATSFIAGAAFSGDVAGGGAIDTGVISRETRAFARNAELASGGAVRLTARSGQGIRAIGASAGGAIVGGAGTGLVGVIRGTTEAFLDDVAVESHDLDVSAASRAGFNLMGGALAVGGGAVGGSLAVAVSDQRTSAYLRKADVLVDGDVTVGAEAETDFWNVALTGGAGGIAVSATAGVNVVSNATEAWVEDSTIGRADQRAANVSVAARDTVRVSATGGAAAVGAVAVGGAATVTVVQSRTVAEIRDSGLYVGGTLGVNADSDVDVEHVTAAAGGGFQSAVSGSASMILIGNGTSGEAGDELGDILDLAADMVAGEKVSEVDNADSRYADDSSRQDVTGQSLAALDAERRQRLGDEQGSLSDGELQDVNGRGRYDLASHFGNGADADVTRAAIIGSTIEAGTVEVRAEDRTTTFNLAGAANLAGGGLAAGGGVAATRVYNDVQAVLQAASLQAAGSVTVTARAVDGSGDAAHALAFAGTVGVVGLGAAWADAYLENAVSATLAGKVDATGVVTVEAKDDSSADAQALGAAAGAAAGGVVVANAAKRSGINAALAGSAQVFALDGVQVIADSDGAVYAKAQGAAGGLSAAGNAAVAVARDDARVRAALEANASLYGGDSILVQATARPQTGAEALGVAVAGGGAVGASVADAYAGTQVAARIEGGVTAEAKDITVLGRSLQPSSGHTAAATATGGTGALVFGSNATVATAESRNHVFSQVAEGATLRARGTVMVSAVNESRQDAYATGVAIAGLSIGANVATARSDAVTEAVMGGSLEGQRMVRLYDEGQDRYSFVPLAEHDGSVNTDGEGLLYTVDVGGEQRQLVQLYDPELERYYYVTLDSYNSEYPDAEGLQFATARLVVDANGVDRNFAHAVSGSGGVLAGAAATANTRTDSSTRAVLQGAAGMLRAGAVRVAARHTSEFDGKADSVQAAVLGASGAVSRHSVDVGVDAEIGTGARVETFDLVVDAQGRVIKDGVGGGYNTQAASGGVAAGAASGSYSDIRQMTRALVGANARLDVVGDVRSPGRLDVVAFNDIYARDRAKLDTGGAITIARAESMVKVTDSTAAVSVGSNAKLDSVGDIVLSGRSQADIATAANAKTYGVAAAAEADSEASIAARQTVDVGQGASLRSSGNIRLYAGRNKDDQRNFIEARANADVWNKTVIPISDVDALAYIDEEAQVVVAEGAELRSVRDIFLYANEGFLAASGKAIAKDLYRQALQDLGAIGEIVEDGELSIEFTKGTGRADRTSLVLLDGYAESGIQHHQTIVLDFVDGQVVCENGVCVYDEENPPEVAVTGSIDGIGYRIYDASLTQNLAQRLNELIRLRGEYMEHDAARAAYDAEISRIEQRLKDLGAKVIRIGESYIVESDLAVRFIELDPVVAAPGDIWVEGTRFEGRGHLIAPGDARIEVINNTPYFLRINGLEIPDYKAGRVMFNGGAVESVEEINQLQGGFGARFATFQTATSSPDPYIRVANTFNPDSEGSKYNVKFLPPDIYISGNVSNLLGEVQLTSAAGSVIAQGDIRANTISISAGRDFVLGYTEGFRHIGPDPKSEWEAFAKDFTQKVKNGIYKLSEDGKTYQERGGCKVPNPIFGGLCLEWEWLDAKPVPTALPRAQESVTVAGNNVFVSARYLNINGTLQSGIPDWNIDLSGLDGAIANAKAIYQQRKAAGNSDPYVELRSWHGGRVKAWWNGELERIELDGIKVEGGYMELFGEIMNTGGGKLKVLDGYGLIDINNPTDYDLVVRTLDVGRGVEGTIKITDLGKTVTRDGKVYQLITVYKREGGEVRIYTNKEVDADGNPIHLAGTGADRSATYAPAEGLLYQWVTGQRKTRGERRYYEKTSATFFDWFDLDWLIPANYENYTNNWTWNDDPRPLLEGDYLVRNANNKFSYDYSEKILSDTGWKEVERDSKCVKRFIGCIQRKYWAVVEKEEGVKEFHTYGVGASELIDIEFIGYDQGFIKVDSKGGLLLGGNIHNHTGTTMLKGDRIERIADVTILTKDLNLEASHGIGADQALIVDVSGVVSAWSDRGDIQLDAVSGDLRFGLIQTSDNVKLAAQRHVTMGGADSLIRGRRIDLTARSGSIGSEQLAVRLDTADGRDGLFTASAGGNIHVNETAGDLRLWQVSANGDVVIATTDGSILDGNTTEVRDDRTYEQLLSLWEDMELTGTAAEARAAAMVQAYERGQEAEYRQYWKLRNVRYQDGQWVADDYDPNFRVTFDEAYKLQLRETLGLDDAAIASLEAEQTEKYHELHQRFGGAEYDPDFRYALSESERAELLEGAVWTEEQLRYSISAGVARGTSDTTVTIEAPNVIGRNVTLIAGGEQSTIGRAVGEVVIDVTEPLTDEQRVALASAERDDVTIEGNIIRITLHDDVDVELLSGANGAIVAKAGKEIYLGGEQDINVRDVHAPVVRIKAGQSIVDSADGTPAIVADELILEAGNGSIGSPGNALDIDLAGKLTARAAEAIHMVQHGGDLHLDYLFSQGRVELTVANGGLRAAPGGLFAIDAGSLDLDTRGSVGSASQQLEVKLTPDAGRGADTGFSVRAGGDLYVTSPEASLAVNTGSVGGEALITTGLGGLRFIGDFQAIGGGDFQSSSDIVFADDIRVASDNGDLLFTAASFEMGAGSEAEAADAIRVKTQAGDANVTTLHGGRIIVDAAGSIRGDGAGDLFADEGVLLSAREGIGEAGRALEIMASELDADSAEGDLWLRLLSATAAGSIVAERGAVDVIGDADVSYGRIAAATQVRLAVSGHLEGAELTADQIRVEAGSADLATSAADDDVKIDTIGDLRLGTVTSGSDQSLTAGGNLRYASLTSAGNLVVRADGHVDGGKASVVGHADVEAGSAELKHLEAERIELEALADLAVETAISRTTLATRSGGDTRFGSAESQDGQQLHAEGLLAADRLTSTAADIVIGSEAAPTGAVAIDCVSVATDFIVHTRGDQTLGSVISDGKQHLVAGGTVTAGNLDGAALFVNAGTLELGSGRMDGDAEVLTQGHQKIGHLVTDGDILLTSAEGGNGDIVFGHLQSGQPETVGEDEERLDAPSITVDADGALRRLTPSTGDARAEGMLTMTARTMDVGDLRSAGADVVLEAEADVIADLVHAKRDVKIAAGNDMLIGDVDYGGELTLAAGRNLWAKVGGDITFARAEVGGDAELYSGGEIAFDSLKAGGTVVLEAVGNVSVNDAIDAGDTISIRSGADVAAGTLASREGAIVIDAAGNVTLDRAESGAEQAIAAGGDLRFNELRSGGSLQADVAGELVGGSMISGDSAELVARRMEFGSLAADGAVRLTAAEDLRAQRVSLPGHRLDAAAALIDFEVVAAEIGYLDAVDTLRLGLVDIGQRLDLASRVVSAKVRQSGATDPLLLNLTGHAGGVAERAALQVDSGSEVRFDRLYGVLTELTTSSERVSIDDAYIPGRLQMETPVARLVAENRNTAYVKGANVQLHEQDYQFRLRQVGKHTDTNAYVLRYDAGYTVQVPNFHPSHQDGGPEVRAESALRFTERSDQQAHRRLAEIPAEAFLRWQVRSSAIRERLGSMVVPLEGPAVNLTAPEGAPAHQEGSAGDGGRAAFGAGEAEPAA